MNLVRWQAYPNMRQIRLAFYFLCAVLCVPAWALGESAQRVDVEEENSLVRPAKGGFRLLERKQFTLGVYREFTRDRTKDRYQATGLGFLISYQEALREHWSGGLHLNWNQWEKQTTDNKLGALESDEVAPLSLFSKVSFAPLYGKFFDNKMVSEVGKYFRPQLSTGFGYTFFFLQRGIEFKKNRSESSEPCVTYGVSARFIWPAQASLRFGWERWRGVRTFRYSSEIWIIEALFGDVDSF